MSHARTVSNLNSRSRVTRCNKLDNYSMTRGGGSDDKNRVVRSLYKSHMPPNAAHSRVLPLAVCVQWEDIFLAVEAKIVPVLFIGMPTRLISAALQGCCDKEITLKIRQ